MAISEVYQKQFPKMVELMTWNEIEEKIEFNEYQLIVLKKEMWRRKNQ